MPIIMVPTSEGSSYLLSRGKRLARVKLAGGADAYGLQINTLETKTLTRLIEQGFVHRLEVVSADFLLHRDQLTKLSESVGHGLLNSAFRRDTQTLLSQSNVETANVTTEAARKYVQKLLTSLEKERPNSGPAAREVLAALGSGLLQRLAAADSGGRGVEISSRFRKIVFRYMERREVPEYLTLVLLEIVNNLQAQTMQTFAQSAGVAEDRVVELYQNDDVRRTIRKKMEVAGKTSTIGWTIHVAEGSFESHRSRLEVSVITAGSSLLELKEKVEEKRGVDVGSHSMTEFYEALPESTLNIDLGLYYLSYLHDLCRKTGLILDAGVQRMSHNDYSVLVLRLMS